MQVGLSPCHQLLVKGGTVYNQIFLPVVRFGNSIVVRKGPSIVQAVLEAGVEETC